MAFDKNVFEVAFKKSISALKASEKVTRDTLRDLSRSVLEAVQQTEDVHYINQVLQVLTPVNRKVAVLYFVAFSGFRQDNGVFTKKDKKNYENIVAKAVEALEDPHFNIWTWAEKEVDVEPKEFTLEKIQKTVESTLKKADKAGFSQKEVLMAMVAGGLDVEALIAIMTAAAPEAEEAQA